jgi:hypothetical protein
MVPFHQARKSAALAHADDIYLVSGLELIHQNPVALLQVVVTGPQPHFSQELDSFRAGFLQVAGKRFRGARGLCEFHQAELHRVVTVSGGRLALDHHAGSRLEQRDWNDLAVGAKYLRHSDFLA